MEQEFLTVNQVQPRGAGRCRDLPLQDKGRFIPHRAQCLQITIVPSLRGTIGAGITFPARSRLARREGRNESVQQAWGHGKCTAFHGGGVDDGQGWGAGHTAAHGCTPQAA